MPAPTRHAWGGQRELRAVAPEQGCCIAVGTSSTSWQAHFSMPTPLDCMRRAGGWVRGPHAPQCRPGGVYQPAPLRALPASCPHPPSPHHQQTQLCSSHELAVLSPPPHPYSFLACCALQVLTPLYPHQVSWLGRRAFGCRCMLPLVPPFRWCLIKQLPRPHASNRRMPSHCRSKRRWLSCANARTATACRRFGSRAWRRRGASSRMCPR